MVSSREIYKRFLVKANKNDRNKGVNILVGHFVLLFNTEAVLWLGNEFDKNGDNIKISRLDNLLETDVELKFFKKNKDSVEYSLPDNFYRHASSFSIADQGECKGVKIYNFEKKPMGFHTNLADDFSAPSFDFEETPCLITKNKLKIYFDDFSIKKVFATYYAIPKIDIAGYKNIDGTPSKDVDTNLSLDNIDQILNRVLAEINRGSKDGEGLQIAKERINSQP